MIYNRKALTRITIAALFTVSFSLASCETEGNGDHDHEHMHEDGTMDTHEHEAGEHHPEEHDHEHMHPDSAKNHTHEHGEGEHHE